MSETRTKTSDESTSGSPAEVQNEWILTVVHAEKPARVGVRIPMLPMVSLPIGRGQDGLGPGTLDSTEISRDHALLSRDGDDLVLQDRSKNGTSVNGERCKSRKLADGDVIGLGPLLLLAHKAPAVFEPIDDEYIIGRSYAHTNVLQSIQSLAPGSATVLIRGETGSGKDLVARAIHEKSRRGRAFEARNCAVLTGTLLEGELFGHARGAFTGADRDRKGLFESATGGTVFLDEIAEASADLQAKLLRLAEDNKVVRIGDNLSRKIDVRLLAASHEDLESMVRRKRFREDLFFRLNCATIRISPLRERPDDIPVLVAHFMSLADDGRGKRLRVDPGLMTTLLRHPWPGNVRELKQLVRLAVTHSREDVLRPSKEVDAMLASAIRASTSASDFRPEAIATSNPRGKAVRPPKEKLERLLNEHQGVLRRVAHALDVHRYTLQRWLADLAIDVADYRGAPKK